MPDQTAAWSSSTGQCFAGRHRDRTERSYNRVIGAALVSAGLAFSATLYPMSSPLHIFGGAPPNHELSEFPGLVKPVSVKLSGADISALALQDLAKLVGLLHETSTRLPADVLLELVTTYRLRDLVVSFEMLKAIGPVRVSESSSGGGGGGIVGTSPDLPTDVVARLVILIEMLIQDLRVAGDGLDGLLSSVLPGLMRSLGIEPVPKVPPPQAGISTLAVAPASTSPETFHLAPSVAPRPTTVATPNSASPDPPMTAAAVPSASPSATPQPTVSAVVDVQVTEPATATASATPEPASATPDPPSSSVRKTNPPDSDTQVSNSGSNGSLDSGTSGAQDSGASSGTSAGTSDNTGGGSSDAGSSGG